MLARSLLVVAALGACAEPPEPPGILDGPPRVLQLHATSAVLGWRVRDPELGCELVVEGPDFRRVTESAEGLEHRVAVTELRPGVDHAYAVRCGGQRVSEGVFQTAPAAGAGFSFAVLGDSGKPSPEQRRLAERMAARAPDFVLHTGDVLYVHDARAAFLDPYAGLLGSVPFWVAWGNHDDDFQAAWDDLFDFPVNGPRRRASERSYFFDHGSARVAVVDSNGGKELLGRRVAPWLREVFGEATAPGWRIVVLHHPPYTWGRHEGHDAVREYLVPVFEELGIDVVFSGHDHNYQRTAPLRGHRPAPPGERGVVYIVTGAGGARLYELKPRDAWGDLLLAGESGRLSFTHVVASADRLEGEQMDADGRVIDRWRVDARAPQREPGREAAGTQ